jgi:hypothetical protein
VAVTGSFSYPANEHCPNRKRPGAEAADLRNTHDSMIRHKSRPGCRGRTSYQPAQKCSQLSISPPKFSVGRGTDPWVYYAIILQQY